MKKIAAIVAATVVASSANAFITPISGSIDSYTGRSSFSAGSLVVGTASGSFSAVLDTAGTNFNSGTLNISYQVATPGYGSSTVTYSNMVYNLTSATGSLVDSDYLGTGTWLTEFSFGYSVSNTSWSTGMTAPSAVKNTNGSYLSNAANGKSVVQSGSISCAGSCSIWGAGSLGIEGLTIRLNVDQNNGFAVLGGALVIQEIAGSSGTFHGTTIGTVDAAVPVPAAAWLMGSGLVGLAGIARRRKMA